MAGWPANQPNILCIGAGGYITLDGAYYSQGKVQAYMEDPHCVRFYYDVNNPWLFEYKTFVIHFWWVEMDDTLVNSHDVINANEW